MANEITANVSLAYADSESADLSLAVANYLRSITTKKFAWIKQNIGTAEEALQLGEVASLGLVLFVNRDATNYIELRTATGGTKFAKLLPGMPNLINFGSGISAPFAIADTAACQLEYLLLSV